MGLSPLWEYLRGKAWGNTESAFVMKLFVLTVWVCFYCLSLSSINILSCVWGSFLCSVRSTPVQGWHSSSLA